MEYGSFIHLHQLFPEQIEKIRRYAAEDTDFLRLCHEFERTADMVSFLTMLIDFPLEALKETQKEQDALLHQLREEITDFLDEDCC